MPHRGGHFQSNFPFPFDETTDIGRRTIFQTFLQNQNQFLQGQFGVPSFGGQQGGGGFLQGQQDFLGGLFNPFFNKFLGQIGSELQQQQGGQDGQGITQFGDFLNQQFDPRRELARSTQRQQGSNTGSLIGGRSRFLTF